MRENKSGGLQRGANGSRPGAGQTPLTARELKSRFDAALSVAAEAGRIAALVGADLDAAEVAGWLHDVSVIIPSEQRAVIAEQLGIDVLPEEAIFPMIIHQKLSAVLAREIFQIEDAAILSAVGCHTTL